MSWKPNRRFRRDIKQLHDQGHLIEALKRSNGRWVFWINGTSLSIDGIAIAAKQWRKPFTKEQLDDAKAKAEEIYEMLVPGLKAQGFLNES